MYFTQFRPTVHRQTVVTTTTTTSAADDNSIEAILLQKQLDLPEEATPSSQMRFFRSKHRRVQEQQQQQAQDPSVVLVDLANNYRKREQDRRLSMMMIRPTAEEQDVRKTTIQPKKQTPGETTTRNHPAPSMSGTTARATVANKGSSICADDIASAWLAMGTSSTSSSSSSSSSSSLPFSSWSTDRDSMSRERLGSPNLARTKNLEPGCSSSSSWCKTHQPLHQLNNKEGHLKSTAANVAEDNRAGPTRNIIKTNAAAAASIEVVASSSSSPRRNQYKSIEGGEGGFREYLLSRPEDQVYDANLAEHYSSLRHLCEPTAPFSNNRTAAAATTTTIMASENGAITTKQKQEAGGGGENISSNSNGKKKKKKSRGSSSSSSSSCKWKSTVDPKSGRTYYYHVETRETQWRKPMELASEEEKTAMQEKEQRQRDFFSVMEANILKNLSTGAYSNKIEDDDDDGEADGGIDGDAAREGGAAVAAEAGKPALVKRNSTSSKKQRPNLVRTISTMDESCLRELVKRVPSHRNVFEFDPNEVNVSPNDVTANYSAFDDAGAAARMSIMKNTDTTTTTTTRTANGGGGIHQVPNGSGSAPYNPAGNSSSASHHHPQHHQPLRDGGGGLKLSSNGGRFTNSSMLGSALVSIEEALQESQTSIALNESSHHFVFGNNSHAALQLSSNHHPRDSLSSSRDSSSQGTSNRDSLFSSRDSFANAFSREPSFGVNELVAQASERSNSMMSMGGLLANLPKEELGRSTSTESARSTSIASMGGFLAGLPSEGDDEDRDARRSIYGPSAMDEGSFSLGLTDEETRALRELAEITDEMSHVRADVEHFGAGYLGGISEDDEGGRSRAAAAPAELELGAAEAWAAQGSSQFPQTAVPPPTPIDTPMDPKAKKLMEKPTGLMRRNTCGTLYVGSTLSAPDKDASIKCVCGVYRAHILQSEKEDHSTNNEYRIFNDQESQQKPLKDSYRPTVDFVVKPPPPSLDDITNFYRDIFRRAQMESDCIIMSLIYVERLIKSTNGSLRPRTSNWRSVLFSCLVLASKVWDDLSMWNADFSQTCPTGVRFSLQRINELEVAVLSALGYKVKVPASEYAKYYFLLRSMLIKSGLGGDDLTSMNPLDVEGAKKLQQMSGRYQSLTSAKYQLSGSEHASALRSKSIGCIVPKGGQAKKGVGLEHVVQM